MSYTEKNIFDDLVDINEASTSWNKSVSTIKRYIREGKLIDGVDCRNFGKQWVILKDAMNRVFGNLEEIGIDEEIIYKISVKDILNKKIDVSHSDILNVYIKDDNVKSFIKKDEEISWNDFYTGMLDEMCKIYNEENFKNDCKSIYSKNRNILNESEKEEFLTSPTINPIQIKQIGNRNLYTHINVGHNDKIKNLDKFIAIFCEKCNDYEPSDFKIDIRIKIYKNTK